MIMLLTFIICTLPQYNGVQARTDDITAMESNDPTVAYPENPLIFKQIGLLFPTLSYAHLRTTLDIEDLDLAVNKTCMHKDSLKKLRHYDVEYNLNPKLSSNMKQEVAEKK